MTVPSICLDLESHNSVDVWSRLRWLVVWFLQSQENVIVNARVWRAHGPILFIGQSSRRICALVCTQMRVKGPRVPSEASAEVAKWRDRHLLMPQMIEVSTDLCIACLVGIWQKMGNLCKLAFVYICGRPTQEISRVGRPLSARTLYNCLSLHPSRINTVLFLWRRHCYHIYHRLYYSF